MLIFILGIFDVFCVFIICFLTIHSSSGVMLLAGLTLVITVNLGYPQTSAYILNYSGYPPSYIYCLSGYVKDYDNANEVLKVKNIDALPKDYEAPDFYLKEAEKMAADLVKLSGKTQKTDTQAQQDLSKAEAKK